ncbi:hypothetical protein GSD1FS_1589 [Bifidobacterium sp. GSD1FS]|uniref:Uncharacterized protein n=1 Tax=Bifidobacterium canis TaxID=2610880 RepID=A0A7K1J6C5_9BIFI|nr:hypothetical protein [Bifidobacterium canis]
MDLRCAAGMACFIDIVDAGMSIGAHAAGMEKPEPQGCSPYGSGHFDIREGDCFTKPSRGRIHRVQSREMVVPALAPADRSSICVICRTGTHAGTLVPRSLASLTCSS